MLTTCIFLAILLPIYLVGISRKSDTSFFFTKDYTTTLKGACALIVILVHIPLLYSNKLQDAVGSFAYVAVTIFFMISAYGMEYSYDNKKNYLKHFWQNRIISLLTPIVIINIIAFLTISCVQKSLVWRFLYDVNDYIICLLEYCLFFFIIKKLGKRFSWRTHLVDLLLIASVFLISFASYLTNIIEIPFFRWCYERFGLIWGLLLYRYKDQFLAWASKHTLVKVIIPLAISLVLGIGYLKFKFVWFWGEYLLKIILGIAIIAVFLVSTSRISFGNKLSRWLGDISYEVYLSHLFVIALLEIALPSLNSNQFIAYTIIGTIIISAFTHALVKRIVGKLRCA